MRFVIRRASNSQYYFTIEGGNYEKMATSETYASKSSAQHAIKVIQGGAGSATVVDQS
jgi:uncharacterized protein YegP (UPF0339 family)